MLVLCFFQINVTWFDIFIIKCQEIHTFFSETYVSEYFWGNCVLSDWLNVKLPQRITAKAIFSLILNRPFYIYGSGTASFSVDSSPQALTCVCTLAVRVVGLPLCYRWVEWTRAAVWVGRPGVLAWRENHRWRDERVAPHCCNCCAMILLIQSMPLSPNPASVIPCSAYKLTCLHFLTLLFNW